jgi:hypothetical protein
VQLMTSKEDLLRTKQFGASHTDKSEGGRFTSTLGGSARMLGNNLLIMTGPSAEMIFMATRANFRRHIRHCRSL